ncbi:MAG: hypothetical protein ACOC1F_06565 [Myxococcota bacterium]
MNVPADTVVWVTVTLAGEHVATISITVRPETMSYLLLAPQ